MQRKGFKLSPRTQNCAWDLRQQNDDMRVCRGGGSIIGQVHCDANIQHVSPAFFAYMKQEKSSRAEDSHVVPAACNRLAVFCLITCRSANHGSPNQMLERATDLRPNFLIKRVYETALCIIGVAHNTRIMIGAAVRLRRHCLSSLTHSLLVKLSCLQSIPYLHMRLLLIGELFASL